VTVIGERSPYETFDRSIVRDVRSIRSLDPLRVVRREPDGSNGVERLERIERIERGDRYFTCLLTSFVISNMLTEALPPKTGFSVASLLIIRRFFGSCSPFFLM